jgi:excisionase family DNA binding protein
MPVIFNGETYYRTSEVCRMVGISRSTLLRWLKDGILDDVPHRDRRGWRLFMEADIKRIGEEAHKVT